MAGASVVLLALSGCRAQNDARPSSDVARADRRAPGVERDAMPSANVAAGALEADARASDTVKSVCSPSHPPPQTDWCIETMSVLDETTCYVLPDAPSGVLLVYFHGIVPPEKSSVQKTNLETVLASAARRARAAALLPRGKQGFAPRGHEGWWGWPTGDVAFRRHAPELLAMISEKRQKLKRLAGAAFQRVYLAGSSSEPTSWRPSRFAALTRRMVSRRSPAAAGRPLSSSPSYHRSRFISATGARTALVLGRAPCLNFCAARLAGQDTRHIRWDMARKKSISTKPSRSGASTRKSSKGGSD